VITLPFQGRELLIGITTPGISTGTLEFVQFVTTKNKTCEHYYGAAHRLNVVSHACLASANTIRGPDSGE